MIELKDVTIAYDRVILDHASISIPAHSITLLRGKSGSGKTALLYCIALMDNKSNYKYYYDGKLIEEEERDEYRRSRIGYVLQESSLLPHLDVTGTLQYFARIHNKVLTDNDIDECLDRMHLDVSPSQNVMTLSLGERQRLSIACALVSHPQVLILDEPTASLDHDNEIQIYEILKELSHDMTIVMASHSDCAIGYADVTYMIEDGMLSSSDFLLSEDQSGEGIAPSINHNFCIEYVKTYMKHYSFMYVLLLMVFVLSLVSCQVMTGIIHNSKKQAMQMLVGQLENKAIITKDEHSYVDQDYSKLITLNDKNAYPLYKMSTDVNGEEVYIVPYFKEDDLSKYIDRPIQDKQNGIYMDESTFYILNQKSKNNKINLDITIKDREGMHQTEHSFDMNGVFKNSKKVHYVVKSQRYIYMPYSLMKSIYEKNSKDKQYIGYVVCYDTYDKLETALKGYEKSGYTINDSFTDRESMNSLNNYYQMLMFTFAGIIILVAMIIDIVLESHLLMQRKSELVLLRISGLREKDLIHISLTESIIGLCAVLVISTIISIIMLVFTGIFSLVAPLISTFVFIIILLLERVMTQSRFIKKIDIVTELRNEVV
ncbi:ATP-binding cassette domain-containing protein [uncultured Catenibacterium sp.]|uniref:ATP-binding cassette domain-containing protein n=1 Tax=uncultured Catenibacterium sp. TaxID=286142 RepID=UPI0025FD6C1D|nr:ATP-binding cassette domain-containing protein [uncultured Catenibacterium sp.]